MKPRANRRTIAWGVAASILVAALAFTLAPMLSGAADEPVIDTAAPVAPEHCAPCHLDLGDVNVPGLVFSHGNHLLVSCDGCHSRMPHREDATERVPMEVCFACHGVEHGPQGELASGLCADCHTKSHTLRPLGHSKTWAKTPHADVANASGVNGCMICHDAPKDCDECHAKEAPEVPSMPRVYHPLIKQRVRGPSVRVYPKGPVSMSQCVYCHTDVDDVVPGRLIFAHANHIQRNYRCEMCHPKFPHSGTGIARPDMMSCYRCHGLNHNSGGQVATEKCDACHPKQFDLRPANHTVRFVKKAHSTRAGSDPAYCAMCHKSDFCVGCHRGEKVSPNAPGREVIPADHKKPKWETQHGPIFLDGSGSCGSCHTDKSCKRCHKTVMPHPTAWIENHKPDKGVPKSDCTVCHANQNSCQACHHQKVDRSELTRAACTPCHDEMKLRPATKIQNKAFAEHAVHFDVVTSDSKYRKERPYRCDDCHVGFGVQPGTVEMDGTQPGLPKASHELRLCYGCHGELDYQNKEIAPYPGRSLCLRCHTDLQL